MLPDAIRGIMMSTTAPSQHRAAAGVFLRDSSRQKGGREHDKRRCPLQVATASGCALRAPVGDHDQKITYVYCAIFIQIGWATPGWLRTATPGADRQQVGDNGHSITGD